MLCIQRVQVPSLMARGVRQVVEEYTTAPALPGRGKCPASGLAATRLDAAPDRTYTRDERESPTRGERDMPWCPQCGYEYERWVEQCPECKVPLVAELPPELTPTTELLEAVYETGDPLRLMEVKRVLEESGIAVNEQADRLWALDGIDLSMSGRYGRIFVLASQAEQARQIIAEFVAALERGDFALPETPDGAHDEGVG
jgi:hypothetical protein